MTEASCVDLFVLFELHDVHLASVSVWNIPSIQLAKCDNNVSILMCSLEHSTV